MLEPIPTAPLPNKWQALGQNSGAVSGKSLPNLSHQSGDNTGAYILALLRLLNELSTTLRNMSTIVSAQDVLASMGSSPQMLPAPRRRPRPAQLESRGATALGGAYRVSGQVSPTWYAQHSLQWPPKGRRGGGRAKDASQCQPEQ